jgi:hypothetical protein
MAFGAVFTVYQCLQRKQAISEKQTSEKPDMCNRETGLGINNSRP